MMRMRNLRIVLLGLLIGVVAACSTTRRAAPVVERAPAAKAPETPKPKQTEARAYYVVKRGDTLYRIALEFGQSYQDLVAWNNLASANDIKVDQVLRVLPPEPGSTASGPQTGSVASTSGVEVRPLAAPVASASSSANNKTGPRGDKRPYSEAALAELQKTDSSASGTAKAEPPKPAQRSTEKPAEKSVDNAAAPSADDDGIGWIWPTDGKLIGAFDGGKKGISIAGKLGQPIVAAGPGTVLYASSVRGYGNLVIVKHTNNFLSAYAHTKTILVKEGQTVNRGQKIAEMGDSDTNMVKLHFEIRQQGKPVDPTKFLPSRQVQ
jgi:lipoprotein NlpD